MLRVIMGFFVVFLFIGCSLTKQSQVIYEEYISNKTMKQVKLKKDKNGLINGSIKGNVTELNHTQGLWNYEVKSNDTRNQKLSYANFTHTKKVAKKGDFVYAIIKNGKLKEIYLIKKANYQRKVNKKNKKRPKIKVYKRAEKHQVLSIPTVESISLD